MAVMDVPTGLDEDFTSRFDIVRPLGQGAATVVYLADDRYLGRPVAVKFLLDSSERHRLRFEEEVHVLTRLAHPHIAQILAVSLGPTPFIVTELVGGPSVAAYLQTHGPAPVSVVLRWMTELSRAMAFAHDEGVIHRDLKPPNLLLDDDLTLRVADFNLAKRSDRQRALTHTGTRVGSPNYFAPELVRGEEATRSTDVYAAGVTLYEMLTGAVPFVGALGPLAEAIIGAAVPDVTERRSDVPALLVDIMSSCLAKVPAGRPADFHELERRLAAVSPDPR